jgi:hypothetical protein
VNEKVLMKCKVIVAVVLASLLGCGKDPENTPNTKERPLESTPRVVSGAPPPADPAESRDATTGDTLGAKSSGSRTAEKPTPAPAFAAPKTPLAQEKIEPSLLFFAKKRFLPALMTKENRAYHGAGAVSGGWGPHLRNVYRSPDGTHWFVVDKGPDAQNNNELMYFQLKNDAWTKVGSQPLPSRVQQNVATLMKKSALISYGVNVDRRRLQECTFDASAPKSKGCTEVSVSGAPLVLAPQANYVGAALLKGQTKVVWWTEVGASGAAGKWTYIYDFGGGWNGPVETILPGFNDFSYVFADSHTTVSMEILGQAFLGDYSTRDKDKTQNYPTLAAHVTLGSTVTFQQLKAEGDVAVGAQDLVVDKESGTSHALTRTVTGKVAYFRKSASQNWPAVVNALEILPKSYRARLVKSDLGFFHINQTGVGGASKVYRFDPQTPDVKLIWNQAESVEVPSTVANFDSGDGLWVERASLQSEPVKGLIFAVCGNFLKALDTLIYTFQLSESKE